MKRYQKIITGVIVAVLLLSIGSWWFIQQQTYSASSVAQNAGEQANVEKEWLVFEGNDVEKPLVIFYPGAFVEPESYSIWASQLANDGYSVYILKMPLNLSILDPNRAKKILEQHPDQSFVLGGHSLGGVAASRLAAKESQKSQTNLEGVFFLASYPDKKGNLSGTDLPILSIIATNDSVLNQENYLENQKYLPSQTIFTEIIGGNHAGFGSYGEQKKDGISDISNIQQQEMIVNDLLAWLSTL